MGSVRGARAGPYRQPTGPQRRKGDQEGLYGVYATLSQPRRRGPFSGQSVSWAATGVMSMNSLDRLARPSDLLMEVGSSQRDSDGYAENTDPATNLHQLVRSLSCLVTHGWMRISKEKLTQGEMTIFAE